MKMKVIPPVLLLLAGLGSSCSSAGAALEATPHVSTTGLVVTDRDGVRHDLAATLATGRPVALIFWQSWCESCLEEAPQLARDAKRWGDRIDFLGVVPGPDSAVDEAAVDLVIEKYSLPYPQVRDRDLRLTRTFEVEGTPTLIVLGRGGEVLFRGHDPPADWGSLTR